MSSAYYDETYSNQFDGYNNEAEDATEDYGYTAGNRGPLAEKFDGRNVEKDIAKLRRANQGLREQMKELSRALQELALDDQEANQTEIKKLEAALRNKEKQIRTCMKKIKIYKQGNKKLKAQVDACVGDDKLLDIEVRIADKREQIRKLKLENKQFVAKQRTLEKRLEEMESMQSEWPTKIKSLMKDVAVYKERIRKSRAQEAKQEVQLQRQQQQMEELTAKNKKLRQSLRAHGYDDELAARKEEKAKLEKKWKEEKTRLEAELKALAERQKEERTNNARELKEKMAELREAERDKDAAARELKQKEKEVRMQVLRLKQLKRQLRQLALSPKSPKKGKK